MELMSVIVKNRSVRTFKWRRETQRYEPVKYSVLFSHISRKRTGAITKYRVNTLPKGIDYNMANTSNKYNRKHMTPLIRYKCLLLRPKIITIKKKMLKDYGLGVRTRLLLRKPSFKLWRVR